MPKLLKGVARADHPVVGMHSENASLLFDRRPMLAGVDDQERGGFRFRGRSVEIVGRPTIKGFQDALGLASEMHESSPYWIGALVSYGEDREDWKQKIDQAMGVTKLARHTLLNLAALYRNSTEETRALAPSPGHLDVVTKLPPAEQRKWLDQARREELTVRELRRGIRRTSLIIEGRAPTMHTVDVTIRLSVEAENSYAAEQYARDRVTQALSDASMKVIGAKAL